MARSRPKLHKMKRPGRIQSAKNWIKEYNGNNIVKGYRKKFGVDLLCAVKELRMLGVKLDPEYVTRLKQSIEGQIMANQKQKMKRQQEKEEAELNTLYSDSDEDFYYIANYTSNGVPFGISWEEAEEQSLLENGSQAPSPTLSK